VSPPAGPAKVGGASAGADAAGRSASLDLVVMGTGPFAVPMLRRLLASRHRVVAVVTRPPRAAPGRRPPPNPVRETAEAAGIPVIDPADVNAAETVEVVRGLTADLFVVCDYGQILSPELLAIPRLGGINLHGSLLPRHRGAAPVQWAILSGDAVTGACVIHMTPALDAGRVLASSETPIGPRDTSTDLEPRLAELGAPLVMDAIERLAAATDPRAIGAPQDPSAVTRAPRLSKADSAVDWWRPAVEIDRRRRAMEPWPRTTTYLLRDGHAPLRLVLEDLLLDAALPDRTGSPATPPGTVLAADETGIRVACGEGTALTITRLIPEGRKAMTAAEFLRGARVVPGQRFGPMPELTPGR
jgi:methionyl-tRNA formyltransferase